MKIIPMQGYSKKILYCRVKWLQAKYMGDFFFQGGGGCWKELHVSATLAHIVKQLTKWVSMLNGQKQNLYSYMFLWKHIANFCKTLKNWQNDHLY